jgi:hypothetical protein
MAGTVAEQEQQQGGQATTAKQLKLFVHAACTWYMCRKAVGSAWSSAFKYVALSQQ